MDREGRLPADRTAGDNRITLDSDDNSQVRDKLNIVRALLDRLGPGLVAVSGGLDSRLLIHLAWTWNFPVEAVHMAGPQFSLYESGPAVARLSAYGRVFHTVRINPMTHPGVRRNTRRRCYHCKRILFEKARELAGEKNMLWVGEGSHADDLREYRPGMVALKELGVHSPFALAGLSKPELRHIARSVGLDAPDQPSRACLLTRFPYGHFILPHLLEPLARAEEQLAKLGLADFRLRVLESDRFILQIGKDELANAVLKKAQIAGIMKEHGFSPFDLTASDKVSGFHDADKH